MTELANLTLGPPCTAGRVLQDEAETVQEMGTLLWPRLAAAYLEARLAPHPPADGAKGARKCFRVCASFRMRGAFCATFAGFQDHGLLLRREEIKALARLLMSQVVAIEGSPCRAPSSEQRHDSRRERAPRQTRFGFGPSCLCSAGEVFQAVAAAAAAFEDGAAATGWVPGVEPGADAGTGRIHAYIKHALNRYLHAKRLRWECLFLA